MIRTISLAEHRAPSERWIALGAEPIELTNADGVWHGFRYAGQLQNLALVAPSAAWIAANDLDWAATRTARTREATNRTRIDLLGRRAARFAKDPTANAAQKLTDVQLHELVARLAGLADAE